MRKFSLEILTKKICTLLAIVTAHRVQTLRSIALENIKEDDSGFQIFVKNRIKTSGRNRMQPALHIPYFPNDENLCVAQTLVSYLNETS